MGDDSIHHQIFYHSVKSDEKMPTSLEFKSLSLDRKEILDVIEDLGFKQMTPVQAVAIPKLLQNKDVCVEACTGSGKTIAFMVPIFEMLSKKRPEKKCQIGAMVVSPTR